jgi:alpha-ketoglutarate-dependent taurine dioxygenase
MSDTPVLASIMSARRLAPVGGETEFSNTYAAYEQLPVAEKEKLDKLRVVHSFEATQRYVKPEPSYAELQDWQRRGSNTLPLVWNHRSGRKFPLQQPSVGSPLWH